jgi:catechol 2,3-dioxygenase
MVIKKINQELPKASGGVRIGHINLKISNLDRSLVFYRDVLGFKITKQLGDEASFFGLR